MSGVHTCLRLVGLGVIALALLALPPHVRAQSPNDEGGAGDGASAPQTGPATANRAMSSLGSSPGGVASEVQLVVRSFGVGNRPRQGEWTGVEIELTDSADKPRNVLVRLACDDIDNDTLWTQRTVVTNPGARQLVWLYFRLPFSARIGSEFPITAHEAEEIAGSGDPGTASAGGGGVGAQFRATKLIGALRYRMQTDPVDKTSCLFAVVGTRGGGLEQFVRTVPPQGVAFAGGGGSRTGHEVIEVIGGLTPQTLPDRWMGLSQFEVTGWTGTGTGDQPSQLREGQAEAIREWVKRGGHLCIVLPPVAQPWIGSPSNPLADIMPLVRVDRVEGVDLSRYRSLLTTSREASLPTDAVVHTFVPENAGPYEAMPIMAGPDGECVVVRRIIGSGAVTVIGIDLTSRKLNDVENALRADHFWNRVLGKRAPLFSVSDWQNEIKRSSGAHPYSGPATALEIDTPIGTAIASNAKAAAGVLLAFVVFLAYWLIAGPLGYYLLKSRGKKQHAWLAFVGAAAVFTVVAWGGANMLKIRSVEGKHLTIVDSIYGQTTHKAKSWMSVFLPRYGEQSLSVAPKADSAGVGWRNLIAPLDSSDTQGAATFVAFTDSRGYTSEARSPDTIAVPARATTKQVQVDWAGVLPANWGMIRPLADSSVPVGQEITLHARKDSKSGERRWAIEGTLVHNLPGPLKNVQFWVVEGQKSTRGAAPFLMSEVWAANVPSTEEWKPNTALDLDTTFGKGSSADSKLDAPAGKSPVGGYTTGYESIKDEHFAEAVAFYSMLTPPQKFSSTAWNQAQRAATHGLDLSRWFTQPTLIVIGELQNAELPIPMSVDGLAGDGLRERIKGRTIVRWVYPLAAKPARAEPLVAPLDGPGTSDLLDDLKGKPE